MELLKEVAHVSGKSGLYRILKPGRAGVIVESLDDKKEKTMLGPTARVSVLKDISIFTNDPNTNLSLGDVMMSVHTNFANTPLPHPKTASDYEMADFMALVAPDYDKERVYLSDVRKLANWYGIVAKYLPEAFDATEKTEEAETTTQAADGEAQ